MHADRHILFDALDPIEQMELSSELIEISARLAAKALDPIDRLEAASRAFEIMAELGETLPQPAAKDEELPEPEATGGDVIPTRGQRQSANNAAIDLLRRVQSGEVKALSDEDRAVLAGYTGNGGGLVGPDGKKGSPYEYFTPKPVAGAMWELLREMGFAGGKVLDPSAGTGVFASTAPADALVDSIELDETSGTINRLVNDSERNTVQISPFEAIAAATPDETYDAVITNVPFGDSTMRGANAALDKRYRNGSLEQYFILRSLEKLRPNGLAVFISNTSIVSGRTIAASKTRVAASMMAEFMGAYRLPNKVFDAAHADVVTDVLVFKKHSRELRDKIEALQESNPAVLTEAKVLWAPFLEGRYFMDEGRPYILGTPAKARGRFGQDVEAVMSDQSIANISKLIRRFGGSRIDLEAIGAAPAESIAYSEGDSRVHGDQTFVMTNGEWVAQTGVNMMRVADETGRDLSTPLSALEKGVTSEQAAVYYLTMIDRGRVDDIPDWFLVVRNGIREDREFHGWWRTALVAMSVQDVMSTNIRREPLNYSAEFPGLHAAMPVAGSQAKNASAKMGRSIRDAFKFLQVQHNRKSGYSPRWMGETLAAVQIGERTAYQKYEALKYGTTSAFVDRDDFAKQVGEDVADDDWCISGDGRMVAHADDYFTGNYGALTAQLAQQIREATDPAVREKLGRQLAAAEARVIRTDIERMTFGLSTPFIAIEDKLAYLNTYVDQGFVIEVDEDGQMVIAYDGKPADDKRLKLLRRYAQFLKNKTLTSGTKKEDIASNPEAEKRFMASLRELVNNTDAQFNVWAKTAKSVRSKIEARINDPMNLGFAEIENGDPLAIPGWGEGIKLHDYQNAEIRKRSRRFEGIIGLDVGLGKTATSLALIQYVHSIGAKGKTFIVVPNSTLSNWHREAGRALASLDDCIFVGMDVGADGQVSIKSSNVVRDLNAVLDNRHRKIFLTYEALGKIPLRPETLARYKGEVADANIEVDASKKEMIAADNRAERTAGDASSKSGAIPFFEDMGVDSMVADELHVAKNSEFGSLGGRDAYKYISIAQPSARGLDFQVKAWYLRNRSPQGDGVVGLTATPITNSPLEVYSMLTASMGREQVGRMLGGIKSGDAFLQAFCDFENTEDLNIIGEYQTYRVFTGLQNVQLLSAAIGRSATIKTAKSAGLKIPEIEPNATQVVLDDKTITRLKLYKEVYRAAKEVTKKDGMPSEQQFELVQKFTKLTGESPELLAHPFNLIKKMAALIADPELEEGLTVYSIGPSQAAAAQKAVDAFNALKVTEDRARKSRHQADDAVASTKSRKKESGDTVMTLVTRVDAWLSDDKIQIDTIDIGTQNKFLAIAEKEGLDLDVSVSPKLAAFLKNFQEEEARPRIKPHAKQIVFCDMLGLQNKVKLIVSKRAGVPRSAIVIVNAEMVKDPGDMQDIQDGFNAMEAENRYRTVIGNEKIEVGVNLQKGTQAMHHLTIGWTPDSIHQRNGRGARQGNELSSMREYHYDADGTFDQYKRILVGKKADWITSLIEPAADTDKVKVSAGLSNSDYELLINSIGDAGAIERIREQAEANAKAARVRGVREAQTRNLQIALSQARVIAELPDAHAWMISRFREAFRVSRQLAEAQKKLGAATSENGRRKAADTVAVLTARYNAIANEYDSSVRVDPAASRDVQRYSTFAEAFKRTAYRHDGGLQSDSSFESQISQLTSNGYVGKHLWIAEDSTIAADWGEAIASARAMSEQAQSEFKGLSREEGAMGDGVVQAAAAGKAVIFGGDVYVHGGYARIATSNPVNQVLRVDVDRERLLGAGVGKIALYGNRPERPSLPMAILGSASVESIGPDHPEYDRLITDLAAHDDAIIAQTSEGKGESINPDHDVRLYGTMDPAVKERWTAKVRVWHNVRVVSLLSPQFKKVLLPEGKGKSELYDRILAQQANAIEFNGDQTMVSVRDGADVRTGAYIYPARTLIADDHLANWLVANGAKAHDGQFDVVSGYLSEFVSRLTDRGAVLAAIQATKFEKPDDVDAEVDRLFSEQLARYTDPSAVMLRTAREPLNWEINRFKRGVAALAAAQVAPVAAAPANDVMVGVSGNTKPHKDLIKDYGAKYGTATHRGRRVYWDGENTRWLISATAFRKLIEDRPDLAGQLTATPI